MKHLLFKIKNYYFYKLLMCVRSGCRYKSYKTKRYIYLYAFFSYKENLPFSLILNEKGNSMLGTSENP